MRKIIFGSTVILTSLLALCVFSFAGISVEPKGFNFVQYEVMDSTFGAPSVKNINWTTPVNEIEIVCVSTQPLPTAYIDWFDHRISSNNMVVHTSNTERMDRYNVSIPTTTNNGFWLRNYYTSQMSIYVDTNTVNSCPLNLRITGRGWKW